VPNRLRRTLVGIRRRARDFAVPTRTRGFYMGQSSQGPIRVHEAFRGSVETTEAVTGTDRSPAYVPSLRDSPFSPNDLSAWMGIWLDSGPTVR
jgi:hypothetical protein